MYNYLNEYGEYIIEDNVFVDITKSVCLNVDDIKPAKSDKDFCQYKCYKDNHKSLNISIRVRQGVDIEKLCFMIQKEVSENIKLMTGIDMEHINIDIQGFIR